MGNYTRLDYLCMYYFGSKGEAHPRLRPYITPHLRPGVQYREPFTGSGKTFLHLLQDGVMGDAWLNDVEAAVAAVWLSIQCFPKLLEWWMSQIIPDVEYWRMVRQEMRKRPPFPKSPHLIARLAAHKLFEKRAEWSGGDYTSSPKGGWSQKWLKEGINGGWSISGRWKLAKMIPRMWHLHHDMKNRQVTITNQSYEAMLLDNSRPAFIYLDPPYYDIKGYLYSFLNHEHHQRLADLLKQCRHPWVLSYNDHPAVRELYKWTHIHTESYAYRLTHKVTTELVITGRNQ